VYYGINLSGTAAPRNSAAKIRSGIVVGSTPLALNIDVPATTVTGVVTINGAVAGTANGYGEISLRSAAGDSFGIASTSGTSYTALVVPGTYDAYYGINLSGTGAPRNSAAKIVSGVVVGSTPLTLNVDVPAPTVTGVVTINGAVAGTANGYGEISLRSTGGDSFGIASTSGTSYTTLVVPGTYDAYYGINLSGTAAPRNSAARLGCFTVP